MYAAIELARPRNVAMAAVGCGLGGALAWSGNLPALVLAMVAVALAAGGANALNDVADVRIDARAHPRRPLPSGRLDMRTARKVASGMLAVPGFLASFGGAVAFTYVLVGVGMVLAYEAWAKQRRFIGNALVAALVGHAIIVGAAWQSGTWLPGGIVWSVAGLAMAGNLARESWKDIEDADADRAERRTMATEAPTLARSLARGLCVVAAAAAPVPVLAGLPPGALIGLVPAGLISVWAACAVSPSRAQRKLKVGMIVALLGIAVGAAEIVGLA